MRDLSNYSLKAHNTFGIDVRCRRFLEYENINEAREVAEILRKSKLPYIIIGGGSNLLLTKDFDGIVVRSAVKGYRFFTIDGLELLISGSGEVFDDMVAKSLENGLYGLENLSLIPGDVGASAVQNIGAYGVEAGDMLSYIRAVEISTGDIVTLFKKDCKFAYRQSIFKNEWKNRFLFTVVAYQLSQTFKPRLDYGNIRQELVRKGIEVPTPQQLRDTIIDIRNAKLPDPKVMGNAGSFFINPVVTRQKYEKLAVLYPGMPHYKVDTRHEKIPAGWMIEQCGWKGKSLGRAGVHDKQALVLVNRGGATGEEVVALSDAICKDVKDKFDIDIFPEVNII